MKKWSVLDKKVLIDSPMFTFSKYKFLHGDKNTIHDFFILDTSDWVNILPLTADNQVVLIRQYRAGIDEILIEIPGGIMDTGEKDPIVTAKRELEEETAYVSDDLELLGTMFPNPSFMTNKNYFVLAKNVKPLGHTHFDPSEYIETFTVPLEKIPEMIRNGEILHSLTINAFALYQAKYFDCFKN